MEFDISGMFSKAASDFLSNAGNALLNSLTGNAEGRISHERFLENEQRTDWHNQRNITRQNDFLAGTVDSSAESYNTFADATTVEDTRRLQERADSLGMNIWDLTGASGGSAPAAPVQMLDTKAANKTDFLQSLIPLQVAEIQAKTQLQQTAMQTQTQRDITAMQTNKGELPKQQTLASYAQTLNSEASSKLMHTQDQAAANKVFLDSLAAVANMLPSAEINLGGVYKEQARVGYDKLVALIPDLPQFFSQSGGTERLAQAIRSMKPNEFTELRNTSIMLGGLIAQAGKAAAGAAHTIGKGIKATKDFLAPNRKPRWNSLLPTP